VEVANYANTRWKKADERGVRLPFSPSGSPLQTLRAGTLRIIAASGSRILLGAQYCCGDPEGE